MKICLLHTRRDRKRPYAKKYVKLKFASVNNLAEATISQIIMCKNLLCTLMATDLEFKIICPL